jgi:hypothetical protein
MDLDLSADQFIYLLAYQQITGNLDSTRADYRHAIQTDIIARSMGGVKDSKLSDWIPQFAEDDGLTDEGKMIRSQLHLLLACKKPNLNTT